jgi:hypothetical protein
VFNELRSRGVGDILIAVVEGLKGLAESIETAFPKTTVQTCIVHLIRNSLDYASWKAFSGCPLSRPHIAGAYKRDRPAFYGSSDITA